MTLRTWLRSLSVKPSPKAASRTRLGVQQLEAREVPAVGLTSAFGVGNDAGDSSARDVAVDAAGNRYVTGSFAGTLDFAPAGSLPGGADVLTARGRTDAYVAKYAADDSLVWVRRMGGDSTGTADYGRSVAVDAGGNVYVTGGFAGPSDFGPVALTTAGDQDGFVAKLAADGGVRWAKSWGVAHAAGTVSNAGTGVGVDAGGNVYALITHSAGTYDTAGYDVVKYKTGGQLDWAKWVNTRGAGSGDLAVTADGKVYAGGSFYGTVDFDPGFGVRNYSSGPTTSATGFVLHLTSAGGFGWASPFQAQNPTTDPYQGGYSWVYSMAVDGGGNVLAGGLYNRLVDFDPGAGTATLPAIGGAFIAKLSGNGSLAWVKGLVKDNTNGFSSGNINGLATDAAGNVYATGSFSGTFDFDPGAGTDSRRSVRNAAGTADSGDAFVLKLDAAGAFQWAETFGGSGDDRGYGIAVDPSGLIHLAGSYQGTVDFDPDPVNAFDLTAPSTGYNRSMFLLRLRQN